jgi:hypothetical protein
VSKLIATEFVSLDGVMEDPGGSEDFEHGGWSFKFERGEEGDQFKLDVTLPSDAFCWAGSPIRALRKRGPPGQASSPTSSTPRPSSSSDHPRGP